MNDGDTLRTTSGSEGAARCRSTRPELHGDCFGKAALAALRLLAPKGTHITLVRDPTLDQTDRYGRLLRYVIVNGTNVNVALVSEGAASPYFFRNEQGRYARELLSGGRRGARRPSRLLGRLPACEAEHRARLDHRPRLTRPALPGVDRR